MFINDDIEIVSHRIDGYDVTYNGVYYYYPRPLSLLYASSALRSNLDLPLPKATDLLNIYYQGHIAIGLKEYKIDNLRLPDTYQATNLTIMSPEDLLANLPERLTKDDLKNDITVSNENRPDSSTDNDSSSNENNTNKTNTNQ